MNKVSGANTEESIGAERVGIIAIVATWLRRRGNVAEGDNVELFLSAGACSVDWEEDGPCDKATYCTRDYGYLEQA